MANNNIPWDQRPEFLAACNRNIQPGGLNKYTVPRRVGATPTDVTDFHPGQDWDELNLPEVMYMLRPDAAWHTFKSSGRPPQKIDQFGQPMFEQYPQPGTEPQRLLDFAILPDKIGTEEQWWFHEVVRRLDPRIQWSDIIMRMEWVGRRRSLGKTFQNSGLNTDCYRGRERFAMLSWFPKRQHAEGSKIEEAVLGRLNQAQILANTTRGSTPGLKEPLLGDVPGNRVALPVRGSLYGCRIGPRTIRRRIRGNNVAPSPSIAPLANKLQPSNREMPPAAMNPDGRAQDTAFHEDDDSESDHQYRQPKRRRGPEEGFHTTSGASGPSWSPAGYGYGPMVQHAGYGTGGPTPYPPQAQYYPAPSGGELPQTSLFGAAGFAQQQTQPQHQYPGYGFQTPNASIRHGVSAHGAAGFAVQTQPQYYNIGYGFQTTHPSLGNGVSPQYPPPPYGGFMEPVLPNPPAVQRHRGFNPSFSSDSFETGSSGNAGPVEHPNVEQSLPQYGSSTSRSLLNAHCRRPRAALVPSSRDGLPPAAAFEEVLNRDSLNWSVRRKERNGYSYKEEIEGEDSDDAQAMSVPRTIVQRHPGQDSVDPQCARETCSPWDPSPDMRSHGARSVRSKDAGYIYNPNEEQRGLRQQAVPRLLSQRRRQDQPTGVDPVPLGGTTSASGSDPQGSNQTKRKRPDLEVAREDNGTNEERQAKRRSLGQTTDGYQGPGLNAAPGHLLRSQPSRSFRDERDSVQTKRKRPNNGDFDTESDQDGHSEQRPSKRRNTTGAVDSKPDRLSAQSPYAPVRTPSAHFSGAPNPNSLPQDSFGYQDQTVPRAKDVACAPEDADIARIKQRVGYSPSHREDESSSSNSLDYSGCHSRFQPRTQNLTQEELDAREFDFGPWLVDGAYSPEPPPPRNQGQRFIGTFTEQEISAHNCEIDQYLDCTGVPPGPAVPDYNSGCTAATDLESANVRPYEDLLREERPHHGFRNITEDGGHGAVLDPSILDATGAPRHASSNLGDTGVGPAVGGPFKFAFDERWYVEEDEDSTSFLNVADEATSRKKRDLDDLFLGYGTL